MSKVNPLLYLIGYLLAIPAFGMFYSVTARHGFYSPYARYEPGTVSDNIQLAAILQSALHTSLESKRGQSLVVGDWKLDIDSIRVDRLRSSDGTQLSFRVRLSADGVGNLKGAKTVGWPVDVSVPERPTIITFVGADGAMFYHLAERDLSKYSSPYKEEDEDLFKILLGQARTDMGVVTPSLALNPSQEEVFGQYLQGIKGDASAFSGGVGRMMYLSAVVITTLGLGDIVPVTSIARTLVALEAITGIIFAGLFLNALSYRASQRPL